MWCFLLLFSFYLLPVLVTEALGEDVMLESTASYAWQCQRPATPPAVDVPLAVLVFLAPDTRRRVSPPMPTTALYPAKHILDSFSHLPLSLISILLYSHPLFFTRRSVVTQTMHMHSTPLFLLDVLLRRWYSCWCHRCIRHWFCG